MPKLLSIFRPKRVFFGVGLYTIGSNLYDMGYASVMHQSPGVNLQKRYGKGTWAVISGCSNDLGKEYAMTLAAKGFNLVLVDASGKGLSSVKTTVEAKHSSTKVVTMYFDHQEKDEWQEYEQLCNSIKEAVGGGQDISILINNVEKMDPKGEKFHKSSDQELLETINANSFPLVFMCRFLGPDLKARQGKPAIINMTSIYADYPTASLPIFSSAKSFSDVFSQNLGFENQDMDVLTVKHMPTKSAQSPLGVDAKEVVEGVFHDLGKERISYGHSNHSLFRYFILWQQSKWWFNQNTLLGKAAGL